MKKGQIAWIFLPLCFLLASPSPRGQDSESAPQARSATLQGIDIFGNTQTPSEEILALIDISKGDSFTPQMVTQLDEKVRNTNRFAHVKVSSIVYGNGKGYLTVDVIEKGEEKRLDYAPEPEGTIEVPKELVDLAKKYQQSSYRMYLKDPKHFRDIDAGHYLDSEPEVRRIEEQLIESVPEHYDLLVRALAEDKNPQVRALAALLLGWAPDKKKVLKPLGAALSDRETMVRTSAARSLIPIAYYAVQEKIGFPLEPVIRLIHYPTASDRNKAGSILVHLAADAFYREPILEQAGDILVRMAAANQPTQRERALVVLTLASGEDFGADVARWKAWWASRN